MNTAEVLTAAGIVLLLIGWLAKLTWMFAQIDTKVSTMWGFLLKRAATEGVRHGLLSVESPVKLAPHAAELFNKMRTELQNFCKINCQGMTEANFALCIEKQFGDRITKEICIPEKLTLGVCILIAVAVAKGVDTLNEILS